MISGKLQATPAQRLVSHDSLILYSLSTNDCKFQRKKSAQERSFCLRNSETGNGSVSDAVEHLLQHALDVQRVSRE